MLSAARAVAFSVLDLMTDPAALAAAQEEFNRRADEAGRPGPLIPEGTRPPIEPDYAPAFMREHRLQAAQDD